MSVLTIFLSFGTLLKTIEVEYPLPRIF